MTDATADKIAKGGSVGVVVLLAVGFIFLFDCAVRADRRYDVEKQAQCKKLGGIVAPARDGWVCSIPEPRAEQ